MIQIKVEFHYVGYFACFGFPAIWCQTYILWPYFSYAGHLFHGYFCHIILVIKAFLV